MRKHPVVLGIFLLALTGILFSLFIFIIARFTSDRSASSFSLKAKVGVVVLSGIITDAKPVLENLDKFSKDDTIKAVILRIDSPGGAVAPSQEIYDRVISLKKEKKVVASMGTTAASGGYYVACAADKIVANPGTLTGSIGVIMHFTNVEDLFKKIGIKSEAIKSGKYKDSGSPFREMTKEEKVLLQGVIEDVHDQFVEVVAANRKLPKEKLQDLADGRVFTGRQALKAGLVDYLGGIEYASTIVAELAGIEGKPELIYPKEERFSIFRYLMEETLQVVRKELREEGTGPGLSYLYLSPRGN
jgi:protease IV